MNLMTRAEGMHLGKDAWGWGTVIGIVIGIVIVGLVGIIISVFKAVWELLRLIARAFVDLVAED